MICTRCQAILPPHYTTCPCCGGKEIVKERKTTQEVEVEEVEAITPYVEFTPLDDFQG